MATIKSLRGLANRSTSHRGHRMSWQDDLWDSLGTCIRCGMEVQLLLKPQANEIDIGGPAVALNCIGPRRKH